ncbi:MAG: ribonuclease E/G [Elioraea sp.]|nr:ribonuclease E/G [Elioraea sp.]
MDRARRLLIASSPGERWLLGLAGERLVRVEIERLRSPDRVGEVHAARVTAIARGLGGAFVRLGDGAEAFLPAEEADPARPDGGPIRPVEASVRKGEIVVVRIVRAAMGGKGLRVSRRSVENVVAGASPPGSPALLAAAPPRALSFVAEEPQAEEILCDDAALVALLKAQGSRIGDRVRHHRGPAPLLDPSLEAEVAALAEPVARLADGMALHVAITPGATVIDVDVTGGPGRETPWRRREAANRAAIREAARQIMLRNLGGVILVDPAGLPAQRGARESLVRAMREALAGDPLAPRVLGVSRAGLLEIVRPRVRPPLAEVLGSVEIRFRPSPTTEALRALRTLWRERLARPSAQLGLRVGQAVAEALAMEGEATGFVHARTGRPVSWRVDPALPSPAWSIEDECHG